MSERIFVDTSAYYALTDANDTYHRVAVQTGQRLAHLGADLYTSNIVLIETHTLLLNRLGRAIAERVLDRLYDGATRILRVTEGDERRARDIIHQYQDKEYSMVDALSFAVMQRLHLRTAWTYDQHFAQMSFMQA